MGNKEQEEGSILLAANAGGHNKLDDLTAIIDRNGLNINGIWVKMVSSTI